jgi:hypothetical protein
MAKKDDLIAQAKSMGIELDSNETVADLEAKIEAKAAEQAEEGAALAHLDGVKRSKVNRGSRRRIERAITSLNKEIDAAIKELDMQAFVADDDGKRTGEWPAVTRLREAKAEVNDQVNQLLAG